jgi:glucose dehydrogenase
VLFGSNGGWLSRGREMMEAYFFALDSDTGKELWRINLGGTMASNPISYMANGKQMVTMAAGGALFTFSLP